MRILIRTILALALGFAGGWAVSLSAILRWWDLSGFPDRDGGGAMAAFFVIGPFFGVVTAIVAATVTLFRSLSTGQPVAGRAVVASSGAARSWLPGAVTGVCVYLVLWCLIDLSGPYGPRSVTTLAIENGPPFLLGIIAGAFAAIRFGRRAAGGSGRVSTWKASLRTAHRRADGRVKRHRLRVVLEAAGPS